MNQVRIKKTRADALSDDYVNDVVNVATFDWAMDALLELGIQDDPCPYSVRNGFRWYEGLPFPPPDIAA